MHAITNIFQNDELAVDFYPSAPAENKMLAITFTPFSIGGGATLEGAGYATDFMLHHGFDVVAIKSARNVWYQNLSHEILKSINRFIGDSGINYSKRVAYGSSMGGYAAIQFSRALNIDVVLALSPQFEIDGADDKRWANAAAKITFAHRINQDTLSNQCKYFVAYDPNTADELHVQKLRRFLPPSQLIEIKTPFSGHPSAYFLAETHILHGLVLDAFRGEYASNPLIRSRRHQSKTYLLELSRALLAKDKPRSALLAIEHALRLDTSAPALYLQQSVVLLALDQREEAIIAAKAASAMTADPELLVALVDQFMALHEGELALDTINRAIAIDASRGELVTLKMFVCSEFGFTDAAAEAFKSQISIAVASPELLAALADKFSQQQDGKLALKAINQAIAVDCNRQDLVRRKIDVCEKFGDLDAAIDASEKLLLRANLEMSVVIQAIRLHKRYGGVRHYIRAAQLSFLLAKLYIKSKIAT
jgi:tetratricopeptide (TPR) repeat protein